ncbi:hypothetical protein SK803_12425 [Lentzea sp. BCCO 10_0856]|uniref:Uncharacterized protein n=1 Tax=Lentzea miocenica TaxID=3095431 RepID=A0ABU4SYP8_9PSEU|nr:hypothetical protein [Lentzea sp. BCCO 10_0856]MDX8031026.1 hypothetical protein [Lentzea sp. BCCO 10_0856]
MNPDMLDCLPDEVSRPLFEALRLEIYYDYDAWESSRHLTSWEAIDFEVRKDRTAQARKPVSRVRAAYLDLMGRGVSSQEACRIVGIDV